MMQKVFRRLLDDVSLRLSLTAIVVTVPLVITVSWLAAAYQNVMGNGGFIGLLLRFALLSFASAFLVGSVLILPLERWVIRDRALRSSRWRAARVLLYLVAGIPIGLAIWASLRFGIGQQEAIVESGYFIDAVVFTGAVATIYTFIEQAAEDVKRREAELQSQIEGLRIEIDEIKKDRRVAEITETEYFRDLRARARELREGE